MASAYLTGFRSPKTRGPGAVAHMSLHLKPTMSKNRRQKQPDIKPSPSSHPGDQCPSLAGVRSKCRPKKAASRPERRIYGGEFRSSSVFFHICTPRRVQRSAASNPWSRMHRLSHGQATVRRIRRRDINELTLESRSMPLWDWQKTASFQIGASVFPSRQTNSRRDSYG